MVPRSAFQRAPLRGRRCAETALLRRGSAQERRNRWLRQKAKASIKPMCSLLSTARGEDGWGGCPQGAVPEGAPRRAAPSGTATPPAPPCSLPYGSTELGEVSLERIPLRRSHSD